MNQNKKVEIFGRNLLVHQEEERIDNLSMLVSSVPEPPSITTFHVF